VSEYFLLSKKIKDANNMTEVGFLEIFKALEKNTKLHALYLGFYIDN